MPVTTVTSKLCLTVKKTNRLGQTQAIQQANYGINKALEDLKNYGVDVKVDLRTEWEIFSEEEGE